MRNNNSKLNFTKNCWTSWFSCRQLKSQNVLFHSRDWTSAQKVSLHHCILWFHQEFNNEVNSKYTLNLLWNAFVQIYKCIFFYKFTFKLRRYLKYTGLSKFLHLCSNSQPSEFTTAFSICHYGAVINKNHGNKVLLSLFFMLIKTIKCKGKTES